MDSENIFMEEHALVLEYTAKGRGKTADANAQVLGTKYFTLLEVLPTRGLNVFEKIYVGKDKRDAIASVKRRISYDDLSGNAKTELEAAIEKIIESDIKRFLDFFNNSAPISVRMHQLELLPGIGKKHLNQILSEREKRPFDSFEDIEKRIPLLPNPKKLIVKRIIAELTSPDEKHYIFVRPYKKKRF
ncbi:MAG: DUF655 domain-containing protein [Candidatus Diapherotrites archaeon]|nr:DUF655 domain-containing protein [Candidatus Diapherotrites archaeon]